MAGDVHVWTTMVVVSEGLWWAKIVLLLFFVSFRFWCIVPSVFGTHRSSLPFVLRCFLLLLEAVGNRTILLL